MATTTKAAKDTAAVSTETPAVEGVQAVSVVVPAEVEKHPVFRDKEFTSRTLILPKGRTVAVVRGEVAATDADLLAFLADREDFEAVKE